MAASKVSSLTLGNFLKIVSQNGVYNNLSEDSQMWDQIKSMKAGDAEGREQRFLLRTSYGAPAVGFVPVSGGAYPSASQGAVSEGTTNWKDFALTIEVERTLIAKAISDMGRYGEPLAEEIRSKTIAMSRLLSASLFQDGSGIIGTVLSQSGTGNVSIVLNETNATRGFIGFFEQGDKLFIGAVDGTARTPDGATACYWVVQSKDRANATVVLKAYSVSADAYTAVDGGVDIVATDVIYRYDVGADSNTLNQDELLTTVDASTFSSQWCGLEAYSLIISGLDKVNGISLSSSLSASKKDAGGAALDSQHFQNLMSEIMVNTGQGRYKYDKAFMSFENLDKLIESREVDRRFNSIQDNKRGVSELGYVSGKNTLIFTPDEFCPQKRIWLVPKGDVMQFHGSDFDFVKPEGGQKFFLSNAASGSGHNRSVRAYMEGSGALNCVHPQALGCISNFV